MSKKSRPKSGLDLEADKVATIQIDPAVVPEVKIKNKSRKQSAKPIKRKKSSKPGSALQRTREEDRH